jgi:hypothetical protein
MTDTAVKKMKDLIPKTITTDQSKDTGMAMVLICLLIAFFLQANSSFMVWPYCLF